MKAKRFTGRRKEVPRHVRRAAKVMPKGDRIALLDFFYRAQQFHITVDVITREVVERVATAFMAAGSTSAEMRILAWRRAIDLLTIEDKTLLGITETMTNERGVRTVSQPKGFFGSLEQDMLPVIASAVRPRASKYDPHTPVVEVTAQHNADALIVYASILYRSGNVNQDVRLTHILHPKMQQQFLDYVSGDTGPGDDGEYVPIIDEVDDAGEAQTTAGMASAHEARSISGIREALGAVTFFARRLWGQHCDAVAFARAERKGLGARMSMTTEQVLVVSRLTTTTALRKLRALPKSLMLLAESETHFVGSKRISQRLRSANCAAAFSIQLELMLEPAALEGARCVADEQALVFSLLNGDKWEVDRTELSESSQSILRRRDDLLVRLDRSSPWLFPGIDGTGPQEDRSVCRNISELAAEVGLAGVTLQVLRDVGAVALIKQDRAKLRRLMVLLRVRSIRTIQRRYAPSSKECSR